MGTLRQAICETVFHWPTAANKEVQLFGPLLFNMLAEGVLRVGRKFSQCLNQGFHVIFLLKKGARIWDGKTSHERGRKGAGTSCRWPLGATTHPLKATRSNDARFPPFGQLSLQAHLFLQFSWQADCDWDS